MHTADKKFSGPGGEDPGLTEDGWTSRPSRRAALDDGGVDASWLRRCSDPETAVGGRCEALGIEPVEVEDGFQSVPSATWDGRRCPRSRHGGPTSSRPGWLARSRPRGEAVTDVQKRVEAALATDPGRYPGRPSLVVTHVTPIKLAVRYCLDRPRGGHTGCCWRRLPHDVVVL